MSTNDSVLLMANGKIGVDLDADAACFVRAAFETAVLEVCNTLEKIVGDGEKVTKLVEVKVEGCSTIPMPKKLRVQWAIHCLKTSWYGNDPNWGRLADAAAMRGSAYKLISSTFCTTIALRYQGVQDDKSESWKTIIQVAVYSYHKPQSRYGQVPALGRTSARHTLTLTKRINKPLFCHERRSQS